MRKRDRTGIAAAGPRQNCGRRTLRLLVVVLLLGLTQCSRPAARQILVTRLTSSFEPLRAQFNRDAGKVRLLILLDPT